MNYININGVDVRYIKQEDGTCWYALTDIIKKVLFKDQNPQAINNKIKDETKVKIFYEDEHRSRSGKGLAYIEHEALKDLILNIYTNTHDINASIKEDAIYKLYSFLNNVVPMESLYAHMSPLKRDYTDWEWICFKTDPDISKGIIWKKCIKCNKYFPNSMHYFKSRGNNLLACQCLNCANIEMFSQNYDVQALKYYKKAYLIKLLLRNNIEELYDELSKNPLPIALEIFKQPDVVVRIVQYLKTQSYEKGGLKYSLRTVSHVTKIRTSVLESLMRSAGYQNVEEVPINRTIDEEKRLAIKKQKNAVLVNKYIRRKREQRRTDNINEIKQWAKTNKVSHFSTTELKKIDKRIISLFIKDGELYTVSVDDGTPKKKIKVHDISFEMADTASVNRALKKLNNLLDKDDE